MTSRVWLAVVALAFVVAVGVLTWQWWGPAVMARIEAATGAAREQPVGAAGPPLLVAVLDVGQGDSIFVRAPSGRSMLIDAGNEGDDTRQVILPLLREQGVSALDYVVLTHMDQDHVGGMPVLLQSIKVGTFVDSAQPGEINQAYEKTLELVKQKRIAYTAARFGKPNPIDLGPPAQVQILNPADPLLRTGDSPRNENSVVLRLTYGQVNVLLTGDVGEPAEERMLKRRVELRSQILKVAHHGSRWSSTDAFLDAAGPEVALISAGAGNRFGHPHREALQRLERRGARIYRTDQHGTILVTIDGQGYSVKPSR